MTESIAFQKMLLFFYLSSLEEKISVDFTARAVNLYKKKKLTSSAGSSNDELFLIEVCNQLFTENFQNFALKQITIVNSSIISWPDHLDLTPWCEFQKRSAVNERLAVLWVNVLNVSIESLAHALNLSQGTIRYRLGKGLSLLGQLNRPNWGTI